MRAHLSGIGWVTTAGTGCGRDDRFALAGGDLPAISRRDVFPEPDRRFGRMDDFSRLGLAAITFALRDAGLEQWQQKRPVGLIAQSNCGCLATDIDYFDSVLPKGGALASPHLFAYTLPNTFLGEAAIRFGLTGSQFIVSEAGDDPLAALRMALESLAWDEEDAVVAGICDLAAPEPAVTTGTDPAGAVFFVLEKSVRVDAPGYGTLSLEQGRLAHAGKPVDDVSAIVRSALAHRQAVAVQDKTG